MNWASEIWEQDDSLNHGFPFPADAGAAPRVNVSTMKTPWAFRSDVNNGFPYIAIFKSNPFRLMVGRRKVLKVYLGTQLVWQLNGINRIRIGSKEE